MNKSTLLNALLSAAISFPLLLISAPAFAQHGGGHVGGGGAMHSGAGGFHGGGGSFHGGAYGGGYGGRYHGAYTGGGYAGRGSYAGPRGGGFTGSRSSAGGHPWSWEGHSTRNTSPGWHQFASRNDGNAARSGVAGSTARSAGFPMAGRSAAIAVNRAAIADGQWHSFAASRTEIARPSVATSINRAGFVSSSLAWRGNYWGWHGGWYPGWHTWGWGWPGWNWGWGWGWGWSWGFGWGAWAPFWDWPPYYYDPWFDDSWLYANDPPAPYVLDPYPA